MKDYIILMHSDGGNTNDWIIYIAKLNQLGVFQGGSSMGGGACISKTGKVKEITKHLSGYIRIKANNIEHAQELIRGNPTFEAGGTIEIRELTQD
ncbi:hypothetical protein C3K47_17125 [Solitalea longa]|uniref:YCII-related domain-containing protein n=1 Tax=Solitalea longa TaxID=2079460 RepID=A0A2S4ZYV6_9SPHI|nr:YciI family protein [Solitalea longa]POY35122.1 hypothetical protein C3K47_17125 [Solitalea longa]